MSVPNEYIVVGSIVIVICVAIPVVECIRRYLWSSQGIHETNWFEEITGCPEKKFRQLEWNPFVQDDNRLLFIKNIKTQKFTQAGYFQEVSLGDLMDSIAQKKPSDKTKPIIFEIISRKDFSSSKYVDVAYLQALSENKNCTFQVASNFNGIETIGENNKPDAPNFTTDYIYDHTQGPIASVSAGGAAIARVHAAFFDPNQPHTTWGQTAEKQVNFLKNLSEHFPVINGYVQLTGLEPPFPEDKEELQQLLRKGKIGYHKQVQVTTGIKVGQYFDKVPNDQIINQIFCAALNMAQGFSGRRNFKTKNSDKKCEFILKLAYQGTYLAAIENDQKHLFLTLIGGGVFRNRLDWIFKAIFEAHMQWGMHPASTLEKVTLVCYGGEVYDPFLQDLKNNNIAHRVICYKNCKPTVVVEYGNEEN